MVRQAADLELLPSLDFQCSYRYYLPASPAAHCARASLHELVRDVVTWEEVSTSGWHTERSGSWFVFRIPKGSVRASVHATRRWEASVPSVQTVRALREGRTK